ncbi:MAG TPA: hypothetical protein VM223_00250, partial [Planctomycetota bacterium]|nr:hypothetical protein [Planctomycetota bacterium]
KEEITAYAEQVVKEVEEERAGEQKSDAQIASEHAGKPANNETPAENDSGSELAPEGEDTAEVEDQGDEPSEGQAHDWLDDDLKAEIAAYGIDEKELADFTSRDELERALRFFDRSALEVGRKALAEGDKSNDTKSARDEKGRFAKAEESEAESKPASEPKEGQYEIKLSKRELYDDDLAEDLIEEFTAIRDHYDSRLETLEARLAAADARFSEADAIAEERHFDNLVDSLGHADLFGKTDKETAKEKERREDLFVEVKTYLRGREGFGRPAEMNETIVRRIARSLFVDEIGKKELKQHTRKISGQSNGRQGGGTTRPQDPREDPREEFDRLYREMERA